jgi:hypothetical protein
VSWQRAIKSSATSTKRQSSTIASCTAIVMAVLAASAILGIDYTCDLLAQRIQYLQLQRYNRPRASYSDVMKSAGPR